MGVPIEPGAPFADYDLWPGTPAARLEKGLSSMLQGAVVDAEGRPVANAIVRWHPVQQNAPGGIPGRRVLEGGTLELPLVTTTGADGGFALETSCFGPGKLTLAGAETAAGRIDVSATAGQTINGLRLQR